MKVKCVQLINPNTGRTEESSPWLTTNKVYDVLEIYHGHDDNILKYRLQSDDNKSPNLHHSNNFEVVSDYMPSSWTVNLIPNKWFGLAPKSWQQGGFWVAYFDGEEWARELYQREVDKMIDEENQRTLSV